MTAADQTERWTLHVHKGPHGGESSVAHTGQCIRDGEWIAVVPAAALDAAREEIERLTTHREAVWVCTGCGKNDRVLVPLVYQERAERAEAELAKAKKRLREYKRLFRESTQETDARDKELERLRAKKANP